MGDTTPPPIESSPPQQAASIARPNWRRVGIAAGVLAVAFAGLVAMAWPSHADYFNRHKEIDALLTLALFFTLGLATVTAIRELYPDLRTSKAVFGLVLVVPLLAFLVLTDRISNVSGGGIEITVNTNLTRSIAAPGDNPVVETVGTPTVGSPACLTAVAVPPQAQQPQQAEQQTGAEPTPTPSPTEDIGTNLGPTVYWRMTLGTCTYDAADLKWQLQQAAATGAFRFILLVYGTSDFFAYIPAADAVRLFGPVVPYGTEDKPANDLVEAINHPPDRLKDAAAFPGFIFHALESDDTTSEALGIMRDQNLDTLPLVDKDGDVVGVVTWERVLTSMMLELATSTSE
jgi:CBS domain-containing protein